MEEFQRTGEIRDKGFLAFSTDLEIAEEFSMGSPVMRLAVRDIPAGTPWIWYGSKAHLKSYFARENEVLLPPGRLHVGTTDNSIPLTNNILPVKYSQT